MWPTIRLVRAEGELPSRYPMRTILPFCDCALAMSGAVSTAPATVPTKPDDPSRPPAGESWSDRRFRTASGTTSHQSAAQSDRSRLGPSRSAWSSPARTGPGTARYRRGPARCSRAPRGGWRRTGTSDGVRGGGGAVAYQSGRKERGPGGSSWRKPPQSTLASPPSKNARLGADRGLPVRYDPGTMTRGPGA